MPSGRAKFPPARQAGQSNREGAARDDDRQRHRLPDAPFASVALSVKLAVPAVVGRTVIAVRCERQPCGQCTTIQRPRDGARAASGVKRRVVSTAHCATRQRERAPGPGRPVVGIESALAITIDNGTVADAPFASAAFSVKLAVPPSSACRRSCRLTRARAPRQKKFASDQVMVLVPPVRVERRAIDHAHGSSRQRTCRQVLQADPSSGIESAPAMTIDSGTGCGCTVGVAAFSVKLSSRRRCPEIALFDASGEPRRQCTAIQ